MQSSCPLPFVEWWRGPSHDPERRATAATLARACADLRADGSRWTEPIPIVDGVGNVVRCEIAFHVDSFIVVWGVASEGSRNGIWARRGRLNLEP